MHTIYFVFVVGLAIYGTTQLAEDIYAWRNRRRPTRRASMRALYAVYCGVQDAAGVREPFTLWTLTDSRLGINGSTVDETWLDEAIFAHRHRKQPPPSLRLVAAYHRGHNAMKLPDHERVTTCATTAGHRWINGHHCQVQVIVTRDRSRMLDPDRSGPDLP